MNETEAETPKAKQAQADPRVRPPADVTTFRVTLPCYDDDGKIYTPPETVLEVTVIGTLALLDTCSYEDGHDWSKNTTTSAVTVDAWALLRALALQLGVSELIVGGARSVSS